MLFMSSISRFQDNGHLALFVDARSIALDNFMKIVIIQSRHDEGLRFVGLGFSKFENGLERFAFCKALETV